MWRVSRRSTDAKVFFTAGGGSDAIDTAGKLARAYWHVSGRPEKRVIVSRNLAYHGVNAYGTSLGGIPANEALFGRLVSDVEQVPWDDADALEATVERLGAERVAAFVCEPVVGAGGVLPPPPGYLDRVAEICRANDVLLIADEVITGFGRLGDWFGSERFGIQPDLITAAKGITSGYVPLGAVIASGRIAEPFWKPGGTELLRHGYTYSGHATACAVALANLDVLESERLVERVRELEPVLDAALRPLERHDARPRGAHDRAPRRGGARRTGYADRVAAEALERGVITRALRGVALQISPPFVITEEQLGTRRRGHRARASTRSASAQAACGSTSSPRSTGRPKRARARAASRSATLGVAGDHDLVGGEDRAGRPRSPAAGRRRRSARARGAPRRSSLSTVAAGALAGEASRTVLVGEPAPRRELSAGATTRTSASGRSTGLQRRVR